jgi:hypothetical protein
MNEDEMMEGGEMQEEQAPMEAGMEEQPEQGSAPVDPTTQMPAEMEQQIVKGATALFHTAVQVISAKSMVEILKRNLEASKLSAATWIVTTECVKIHTKQGLPVNPPMIMAAVPYIASYLQSIASKRGTRLDDRHVKKAVLETIDKLIGKYQGSKMLEQHKEQAAAMRQSQQQQPPPQGMGAPAPVAPQGGMM